MSPFRDSRGDPTLGRLGSRLGRQYSTPSTTPKRDWCKIQEGCADTFESGVQNHSRPSGIRNWRSPASCRKVTVNVPFGPSTDNERVVATSTGSTSIER